MEKATKGAWKRKKARLVLIPMLRISDIKISSNIKNTKNCVLINSSDTDVKHIIMKSKLSNVSKAFKVQLKNSPVDDQSLL